MPSDKLQEARSLLVRRLDELEGERKQLIEAIEQLDSLVKSEKKPGTPRAAHAASAARRGGGRRKRAPRGEREKQLLSSIESHPDFRVSEHAREVGVSPQQLYPLLNRLVAKDAIEKKDKRYALKV